MATGSALFGFASVYQLKLTGWFDSVIEEYGDDKKYPFGPPSSVTRQIIDDPDQPIISDLRNTLFSDAIFGAKLGMASAATALLSVWM